jgi:hypothetical protein
LKRLTILSVAAAFLAGLLPLLAQQPATPPVATPAQGPGPVAGAPAAAARGRGPAYTLTDADRQQVQAKLTELDALIKPIKAKRGEDDLMADVDVHSKAAHWVLEFPEDVTNATDIRNVLAVLDRGIERAKQLQAGQSPWTTQKGTVAFGYYSPLDGSVQPYQLTIPESYDGSKAVPLFGWMHGRNAGINTSNFLYAANIGGTSKVPDWGQLEVQFLGRGNNASHQAGEVDVYETVAAISRRFKVDSSKLVLRGFSLGGAGAWHVALHNPSMWVAADIGAGTWPRHYLMKDQYPPYQAKVINIWENMTEWALNGFNLPLVGHSGDADNQIPSIPGPDGYPNVPNRGQLESSIRIREQLAKEGFPSEGEPNRMIAKGTPDLFLISANTGHGTSQPVRDQINAFLKDALDKSGVPDHIKFLTYTTRYNKDYWVTVEGMTHLYERADIDAQRSNGGKNYVITTHNIARLVLRETRNAAEIKIDGQTLSVKGAPEMTLEKSATGWKVATGKWAGLHKIHGLQGPIDDAFLDPYLLVRPTGTPWNAAVNDQALRTLQAFDHAWARRYFAHPRIKNDTDVTDADLAKYNVVLFGDPGSNKVMARVIGRLPLRWTKDTITVGTHTFPAAEHIPALAYPNPLNQSHYVVLNTGLTFSENSYNSDYALPMLGDLAVLKVAHGAPSAPPVPAAGGRGAGPAIPPPGEIAYATLLDENWQLPND